MNMYREAFHHVKAFPAAFWIVIAATFINQAGNMGFVFLVLYGTEHLGLSLMQASFAFAVFSGSMLVSGIIGGSFIDQIGAARVIIGSVFANGVTLLLITVTHQFHILLILCIFWGLFFGIYRPATQTFISHLSTPGLHKITFSVYRLVLNLGMSIGPAMGGYLATHSFQLIFLANGIGNLIACFILFVGLSGSVLVMSSSSSTTKRTFSLKWLKQDAALRLFIIGMIPAGMVFFQHESTLAVYLKNDLHLSMSFYGFLFTINTLMIVFFELLLNVATLNWPYRVNFMLGSFLLGVGFAGMYFATTGLHIVLLTVVWTIGEMILYPSATSYIAEIAPAQHRGSYMGMFSSCTNMGLLLGPGGAAIVMQHFGSHALWLACGVFGLISVAIFNFVKQPFVSVH